jgi:hypothetical protein
MNLTETLKVRLPEDTHKALIEQASREDVPVSIVLRRAVKIFLAEHGPQKRRVVSQRKPQKK